MSSTAAGYATAFLEIAKAEGVLGPVLNELATFAKVFENSPELQSHLTDSFVPVERRQSTVAGLLGDKASAVTVNLVSTLVGAGRARELPSVVDGLLSQAAAQDSQDAGEVRSAYPLSDEQKAHLAEAIAKKTGRDVALTYIVDPSVMGGVVTRIGDTIIDGSIRNRLDQLRAAV